MYLNLEKIGKALGDFKSAEPFHHCVVDGFFEADIAQMLELDFLGYENEKWFHYKNSIEDKKALNDWNAFPSLTYKVFGELASQGFCDFLSKYVGVALQPDQGLHGGGWHIHGSGGNLNPHLDYSIHPKLGLQRKLNIIIYLSSDLKEEHGGHLGLWNASADGNINQLVKEVQPIFNRAVIFDTTQNSWHGMSRLLVQPEGIYRKSLAIYYLQEPCVGVDARERALFAPREDQKHDSAVKDLIEKRADARSFSSVYRK